MANAITPAAFEPDTSKYRLGTPQHALALAAILAAEVAGEEIESRCDESQSWRKFDPRLGALNTMSHVLIHQYRIKPKPVVTEKLVYELYVPMLGSDGLDLKNEGDYAGSYATRKDALERASIFAGAVLIQPVHITYHDGVEVSREETRV